MTEISFGPGAVETLALSRDEGLARYNETKGKPDVLKQKKIPPSLLSAEHIRDYVLATGLISPFYLGGEKPRLKKASYEGRIGDRAFEFRNGILEPVDLSGGSLLVRANSIVFVESDLDFRLPEYIALRFNLHITHVHRGLLLGTGPLVDPDFRGKLCIPLHNLTSQDYEIGLGEGLIWVEFTKTTSNVASNAALGVPPSNSEFWDIQKFIQKASRGVGGATNVPIQSSIPVAVSEARDQATEARDASVAASVTVDGLRRTIFGYGVAGLIATVIAIGGLLVAYWQTSSTQTQLTNDYVASVGNRIDDLTGRIEGIAADLSSLSVSLAGQSEFNDLLASRIITLETAREPLATSLQELGDQLSDIERQLINLRSLGAGSPPSQAAPPPSP